MATTPFGDRIQRTAQALRAQGNDFIFVTPGANMRYLSGYDALPLERLTCLVVHNSGQAWMAVPALELPAAQAAGVEECAIQLIGWQETQDPYLKLASVIGSVRNPIVDNHMWVEKAFNIQRAVGVPVALADSFMSQMRIVKSPEEIDALREAGRAIDDVHQQMGQFLQVGRTERQVARDIADAIIQAGHQRVDFVIVASGPNGASPHHEVSDRVIASGEPVVVDIGGTMPSGYCSDSTRMYACGEVSQLFLDQYKILQEAQALAFNHAKAGVSCESVDAVARDFLAKHNLAEYFIHRTGHGIGLETHEDPYIISGNSQLLAEGHAFSIEPGFYIPDLYGARIEDIVTIQDGVAVSVNNTTHELVIL